MKTKHTLGIFVSILSLGTTHAALTSYDGFTVGGAGYTAGGLEGQNPTIAGYTGAWQPGYNGAGTPVVASTGLSYAGLQTTGGGLTTPNDGARTGRVFSTAVNDGTNATIYVSFLMQVSAVAGGYKSFEMQNGSFDDNNRVFQLGMGGDFPSGATNFGVRLFNNGGLTLDLGTADTNVNLFVLKFVQSSTNNLDTVTVWRNPVSLGGAEPVGGQTITNFNMSFDRLSLGRFGGDAISLDEIRMGDDFASVTPVPEPSAALLGLVAIVGLISRRKR